MSRKLSAVLAAAALLALAACGEGESPLEPLRERLEEAERVVISAGVEGGGEVYDLTLTSSGEGLSVSVDGPEEIAGVRVERGADGARLEYDGLILPMDTVGLSPISALPALLEALEAGYESLRWTEGGEFCSAVELSDTVTAELRFDEGGSLIYAELLENGESAAKCNITSIEIS